MEPEDDEQLSQYEQAQRARLAQDTPARPVTTPTLPKAPAPPQPVAPPPELDQGVRRALAATAEDSGDEGTINRLATLTGVAPEVLRALEPATIAQMAREQGVLANTQDTPTLRGKFADPDFARTAASDVPSLAEIERRMLDMRRWELAVAAVEAAKPKPPRKPKDPGMAGLGALSDIPLSSDDLAPQLEAQSKALTAPGDFARSAAAGAATDSFRAGFGILQMGIEVMDEGLQDGFSGGELDPSSPLQRAAQWANAGSKLAGAVGDFIAPEPTGDFTYDAVMSGGRSAGSSITWVLASIAARNPQVGLYGMGATAGGIGYLEGREQGLHPYRALGYGLTLGAVEYFTEKIPMHLIIGDITNKTPIGEMILKNIFTEQGTEQVATVGENLTEWMYLNPDKTLGEFAAEMGPEAGRTAIATLASSIFQMSVVGGVVAATESKNQTDTERSEAGLDALDAMVNAAADSKLRDANAEQFEQYVESLAQDAPIRAAYMSPEAFAAAAAAEGKTPQQLAEEFGVESQVDASLATGAALEIPLGRFVSRVSGRDNRDAFMNGVSWSAFTYSRDQLKVLPDGMRDRLMAEAEQLAQAAAEDETINAQVETIRAGIEEQLNATGRFVGDPNRVYSRVASIYYANLARRLGKTPEEVFAQYPLKVVGESLLAGSQTPARGEAFVEQEGRSKNFAGREAQDAGFAYLDTNPEVSQEALAAQLDVTTRQASLIRKAWKEARGIPDKQKAQGARAAAREAKAFEYFDSNPNAHKLPVEAISKALGVSLRQADTLRNAWRDQRAKYDQLDFEPLADMAAQDLIALPEEQWNDAIKATKYAAYALPEGVGDVSLPRGYVVVRSGDRAYAVTQKHLEERRNAGAKVTRVSQEKDKSPRGEYYLATVKDPATINLLRRADLSTFIHELGHHFLELQTGIAYDLQNRLREGGELTVGEQEILDDTLLWLRSVGLKPPTDMGRPGESMAQDDVWVLRFFENFEPNANDATIKATLQKLADNRKYPVLKVFKTTAGRIITFPADDYSHNDARSILEHYKVPDANLKMEHGEIRFGETLRDVRWYDRSGTLVDTLKYDQLDTTSFKSVHNSTPVERALWFDENVTVEATPGGGRTLLLKSRPELKKTDITILLSPSNKEGGFGGFIVDMQFKGTSFRPAKMKGQKATPAEIRNAQLVFSKTALAVQAFTERNLPEYLTFVGSDPKLSKMYEALIRQFDYGYEARIEEFNEYDTRAEPGKERAVSKVFTLIRPDVATDIPLELYNATLYALGLSAESYVKQYARTEIVRPGNPAIVGNPVNPDGTGDGATGAGSYQQGESHSPKREAIPLHDITLLRASEILSDEQFEAFKLARTGMSNDDIAASMDETGEMTRLDVAQFLAQARRKGFFIPKAKQAMALGADTLRVIALSAAGRGPKEIAETVYGTADKAGQVRVLRNRHKAAIEKYKAERSGKYEQGEIFFSALKRAVEGSKQAKATATDWKAILSKSPGVKAEEIQAVGLFDYLDMLTDRGQKQITREDIAAFLESNGVRIEEVLLGPPVAKPETPREITMEDMEEVGREIIDQTEYDRLVAENRQQIDDAVTDHLKDTFAEEAEVFLESNNRAARLFERALESAIEQQEQEWREEYFGSGYFDPPFYIKEEEKDDYDGDDDPPMVWVIKNQHYSRARQDEYGGPFDTEDAAQNAADELNMEEESEAADDYVSNNYREIRNEARSEILENLPDYDFYDELFGMWREGVEQDVIDEVTLDATRMVFNGLGQAELFDRINPNMAPAGWTSTGPRETYPPTKWDSYTLVKGTEYRELLLTLASHKGTPFEHRVHWPGQKNMLAHVRFSVVDGVLVLDEIQSDWHQKGRDEGYQDPAANAEHKAAMEEVSALHVPVLEMLQRNQLLGFDYLGDAQAALQNTPPSNWEFNTPEDLALATRYQEAVGRRAAAAVRIGANTGVPDAPMKDSKSWGALVLKRMIRWAAENGYSEIAWTPGDVHAERWNMFNVADTLRLYDDNVTPGKYFLVAEKDGRKVFDKETMSREDVVEHLGKALTDELFAVEPAAPEGLTRPVRELKLSEDTMLGKGRGMRFFYDTALVQVADRLLKKHGGKVGEKVFAHPGKTRKPGSGGYTKTESGLPATAYHHIVIPESLKEEALAGMPLFQPIEGPRLSPAEERMFSEQMRRKPGDPLINAEKRAFFRDAMRGLPDDANELDIWQGMTGSQKRFYHEIFARQTEQYFMRGDAPVPSLQRLFNKVRAWMTTVYQSLADLNVEMSDEVKGVFDRMFAASQDIAASQRENVLSPLFTVRPDHMTEPEWEEYQALNAQAVDDAEATLSQRSLRDVKWLGNARSRELKRLQAEATEQRKAMRAQVTSEVMAEPVNVARRFLSRGEQEDGTPVEPQLTLLDPEGNLVKGKPKLSIAGLEAMYPEGSGVDWKKLGFGKWGLVSKDGLHPDALAPMLGYKSGDQLVRELLTAENAQEKISGITDQRMLERYGDLTDEKAIARAADEAVYSGLRGRVLAAEYAALTAAMGKRSLLNEAAQAAASKLVGRMPHRKLSPARFMAAERQAGKRAEEALRKNDLAGAAAAKKDQILSFYMTREVMAKQKERDKAMGQFQKILRAKKDSVSKSRNFDLVQAARAVLASYGMAQMANKPKEYLKAIQRYDPVLYSSLEPTLDGALSSGMTIKDLSVDQFMGVRDVVQQLWDLAREEMLVEINGQKMDLADVTGQLNQRMADLGADPNRPVTETPSDGARKLRIGESFAAALRRVESWARLQDGDKPGPFTKFLWRPVSQAATRYRADMSARMRQFRDLFKAIEPTLYKAKIHSPELGYTFRSKADLLHAILHTGNDSNKRKLLLGYRWATEDANGNLDTTRWDTFMARMAREGVVTVADYQFAQGIWDMLEEIKPLAQTAHRRVFGRYFSEITANPVQTPFGEFRGGYVPAISDDFFNTDMALKRAQETLESHDSSMFPAPAKGFTEARVEYNQPLQLDLRILGSHIDKVLRFAHMAAPTRDVLRILRSKGVERNLHDLHPSAIPDILLPWLNRAAKQTNEFPLGGKPGHGVTAFSNGLRARANMGIMFANLINVLQQPTGLFNAAAYKGFKKRELANALVRFLRDPAGTHKAIRSLSQVIATRSDSQAIAMRDEVQAIAEARGPMGKATAWFARHTYFAQIALQNQQDAIVWLAALESAKSKGETEAEAVEFADAVVRQTQGSAVPEDISRFETGTGWHKVLVSMYGYFNMWGNQLSTEFRSAMRDLGLAKGKGRMLYVYMVGFMAPAVLAQFIADALRGDLPDEEEDEEEPLVAWLQWFFSAQAKGATAMVPLVGSVGMAGVNAFNEKPYDDRVMSSPAISVLEAAARTPANIYDFAIGEGDGSRTFKDAMTLLTLMTGVPFQALNRPVGYAIDVLEGDVEPEDGMDAARGAIAGR